MGLLDGFASQIGGGGIDIDALAARVGLTPQQVQAGLAAIGVAQAQDGDTASAAADQSGLPVEKIAALLQQIGGENAIARIGGMLGGAGAGGLGDLLGGFMKR